ncbi:MAG TPA: hypothetical protein VMH23_07750 [Bacteroidota bacterium]|nr:hypothetical protein [Bacteroidota bacterium]
MNQDNAALIAKLNPAIPRRYLFALAGILWMFAGGLLCFRGELWLEEFPSGTELLIEVISLGLAAAGYVFFFFRIVQKNIDRIGRLPEKACLFAFTAWHGYIMIATMMTLGITLRTTAIPKYYLSIPYTVMGGILLIGSLRFYQMFWNARAGETA